MQTLVLGKTKPIPQGFDESPPIALLSVEVVDASKHSSISQKLVERVLYCCPNVTALEGHLSSMPVFTAALAERVPKLRSLRIAGYDFPSLASMQVIGPQLRELRFVGGNPNEHLLTVIGSTCRQLQTLEISSFHITTLSLVELIQVCKHLSTLIFDASGSFEADHITELLGFRQIKKITIYIRLSNSVRCSCVAFAGILERRPDLEWLQVGPCKYARSEGILSLASDFAYTDALDAALVSRILPMSLV